MTIPTAGLGLPPDAALQAQVVAQLARDRQPSGGQLTGIHLHGAQQCLAGREEAGPVHRCQAPGADFLAGCAHLPCQLGQRR
ncbi:hypothetical protein ASG70_13710 [Phycicoccus sp. Soil748]|nr:hypothetical protein ASG70_13710 [Phycicoccus sp. Soil748]